MEAPTQLAVSAVSTLSFSFGQADSFWSEKRSASTDDKIKFVDAVIAAWNNYPSNVPDLSLQYALVKKFGETVVGGDLLMTADNHRNGQATLTFWTDCAFFDENRLISITAPASIILRELTTWSHEICFKSHKSGRQLWILPETNHKTAPIE